ncbi:EAL domain-containing protein [Bradyrhizobium sp. YR681]|uniref:EAL domain-containing protein n=1 Tax=Bradyrhizobium sp. YR681 TaxID=1144344 RepID=UPI000270FE29|nr:EAL domain-containing protein [Bradyrhizobium sp. YR681]EJN11334.1 EAL domain-containing protein [Bradyrhizobium sp. YR681]
MAGVCKGCGGGAGLPFEFRMAFQPIVAVNEQRVWGYEALVRGPQGESAQSVLSQLTEDQLYRFDQAARVMAIETAGKLFDDPQARLSINFMPNAVYEPQACIQQSLAAARRSNFPPANLMFEFTENERMSDPAHVEHIVRTYKKLGFLTALDDFGAGYAGLSLLARLQPDLIKVDMELLRDIHLSRPKQVIVAGIASMARELDIRLLAEGVESEAELTVLRAAGIDLFQGYYFSKPGFMSLPDVSAFSAATAARAG